MNILVTGAAGFIGSHLAESLVSQGHQVNGLDAFTDYYSVALKELNAREIEQKGVSLFRFDLAEDDLMSALKNVDVIYHLAAQPGISASTPFLAYERNNILATYRLLEAAIGVDSVRYFINISTSSVYGYHATDSEDAPPMPTSYYGVTKLAAEQMALAYSRKGKLLATSIRLFSVYGERDRPEKLLPQLMHHILAETQFPLFEGSENHLRSFTYIKDAIDGLILVLKHLDVCKDQIFNIGSDIEISTSEVIEIVQEIMCKTVRILSQHKRVGDQLRTHANIKKARSLLGYNPKIKDREGIENFVKWYQENIF